jgi:proline racemase
VAGELLLDPGEVRAEDGLLDRSPCGTGTCARMAALHALGQLAIGADFTHTSIIGSRFTGRLTQMCDVASIAQPGRWTLDRDDPYQRGYTLPDIWPPSRSAERAAPHQV